MTKNLSGYGRKLKLVAVTKGRSAESIIELLSKTGIKRIGENRLEEAEEKLKVLPPVEKHFLGKLQSRKIKKIVELFDVIQTVENFEQAKKISDCKKNISIFIQVNISGESNRSGVRPQEFATLLEKIKSLPHLKIEGVMGMASLDPQKTANEFALLKSLQNGFPECSMGMSDDFELAIKNGCTMLRLGRVLFEEGLPSLPDFE